MVRAVVLAGIAGLGVGLGCALPSAFACRFDSDCANAGAAGTCEADGWCSFPDGDCESGRRYGDHAGDGLGGACVGPGVETSGAESSAGEGEGTTSTASGGDGTSDGDGTSAVSAETAGESASTTASDSGSTTAADTGSGSSDESGSAPSCGNGFVEGLEECDGGDFDGTTCQSLGYDAGVLMCAMCQIDESGCISGAVCGNNIVEQGEDCEGPFMLAGGSCVSLGHPGGSLGCTPDCMYETSGCWQCGNDVWDPNEECDGLDKPSCGDVGLGPGVTSCNGVCALDTSGCAPP
jgi:hypothetical protein